MVVIVPGAGPATGGCGLNFQNASPPTAARRSTAMTMYFVLLTGGGGGAEDAGMILEMSFD